TRHSQVVMKDDFWAPKIARNAEVTIPFEVQKLSEGGRGFGGGVLEAAILSLETRPNPSLQTQVDGRMRAIAQASERSNRNFEIAATYFNATGRREPIAAAIKIADVLYTDFQVKNPPFSGGERDAINRSEERRVG